MPAYEISYQPAIMRQMSRRFQFSLRALLLLMALIAVGCLVGPSVWQKIKATWFSPKPLSPWEGIGLYH
jgi:hypothetical protein